MVPLTISEAYSPFLSNVVYAEFRFYALIKPRQGFLAITLCVRPCMCVCVCVSVNNIAQKVFNQSTSFLVADFPLAQG